MLILPKLLYLFHTLIIPILHSYLTVLQKQITTFVWDSKPPRCANSTLTRPHYMGGVGLPHIGTYYHITALDQIYYWWNTTLEKIWSIIETSLYLQNCLVNSLLLTTRGLPPLLAPFPSITTFLEAWKQLSSAHVSSLPNHKLPIPLRALNTQIHDLPTHHWQSHGIMALSDLMTDKILKQFNTLCME